MLTTLLWGVLCVILPSCVLYKAGDLYVISLPLWGAYARSFFSSVLSFIAYFSLYQCVRLKYV